jgi:hypothetical protein
MNISILVWDASVAAELLAGSVSGIWRNACMTKSLNAHSNILCYSMRGAQPRVRIHQL